MQNIKKISIIRSVLLGIIFCVLLNCQGFTSISTTMAMRLVSFGPTRRRTTTTRMKLMVTPSSKYDNGSMTRLASFSSSSSSFRGPQEKLVICRIDNLNSRQHHHHHHQYYQYNSHRFISKRCTITMMPEGPEIRTATNQLRDFMIGKRLVDIQFLSGRYVKHGKPKTFYSFAKTMTPTFQPHTIIPESIDVIEDFDAKGKFIYIILDKGGKNNDYNGQQPQINNTESNNEIIYTVKDKGNNNNDDYDDDNINHTSDDNDNDSYDFQRSIWITFGMTGQFVNENVHKKDPKFARWYIEVVDVNVDDDKTFNRVESTKIYYHDQRNFGTLKFCLSKKELDLKLQSLGPDILNQDTTTEDEFLSIISKQSKKRNICVFLMDQSKLSGVGNYILSESLYRASIDPYAAIDELTEKQCRELFHEIQSVAMESYLAQGLTRPDGGTYKTVDGSKGNFEFQLQCYGRDISSNGERVIKDTNGPHKRAIWYTNEQLFMPLSERRQQLQQQQKSPRQQRNVVFDTSRQKNNNNDDNDYDNTSTNYSSSSSSSSSNAAVQSLMLGLKDSSWKDALSTIIQSKSFQHLASFIEKEYNTQTIYPPKYDIFNALNLCPLSNVKVVIVGQDPYHGPNQGHGLAFSVQYGFQPLPPSLKNILQEVRNDIGIFHNEQQQQHGNLEYWAKQGVLLLNTVLTVRKGQANSHSNNGWEEFTDEIITILNEKEGENGSIVFLLWGNQAAKKGQYIDETKHYIIKSSHPSPLSATKTNTPFINSKCFSRTNQILEKQINTTPIDWNIFD